MGWFNPPHRFIFHSYAPPWCNQIDAMGKHASMASCIEVAAAVVVCVTETYESSNNCIMELNHAKKSGKPLFF